MKLVVVAFAALPVTAQVFEMGMLAGVSRIGNRDIGTLSLRDTTRLSLKDGFRIGFRMTFNKGKFLGQELGYAYNRTAVRVAGNPPTDYGTAIHQGFYNGLLYATKEGIRVRPFAAAGGHFSNFIIPGSSVQYGGGSTKFGFNYGGGIKVRVTQSVGFRLDFRQYVTGKPFDFPGQSGLLRQTEVSAGVSLML